VRILVTGARGSLGSALCPHLDSDATCVTDLDNMDVCKPEELYEVFWSFKPELVYHLAGMKSAPSAEEDPEACVDVNIYGTRHVLWEANRAGAKVVTASTCKAADPETIYGSTKLIAERLTLRAGGWVARFYNVRESSGNVFETWAKMFAPEPIPVTSCKRYFISADEAVSLLLTLPHLVPGRYTLDPGPIVEMSAEAERLYPGRQQVAVAPRRGDRLVEPRCANSERLEHVTGRIERIVGAHD
jgi:FlaA1/EpsC-like NDP-sugar epimerase